MPEDGRTDGTCSVVEYNKLIKVFSPTGAKWIVLKTILKSTLKLTLKHLTTVTLASSNSALPDDGDYTETC
jgi:hypothetical protein